MEGIDFGKYLLKENTTISTATEKIREFVNKIDVKYLANHPEKLDETIDTIENMSSYIITKKDIIEKMIKEGETKSKDYILNELRVEINALYRKILKLSETQSELEKLGAERVADLIEGKLKDANNILNTLPKLKTHGN